MVVITANYLTFLCLSTYITGYLLGFDYLLKVVLLEWCLALSKCYLNCIIIISDFSASLCCDLIHLRYIH